MTPSGRLQALRPRPVAAPRRPSPTLRQPQADRHGQSAEEGLLRLQRVAGNRATLHFLQRWGETTTKKTALGKATPDEVKTEKDLAAEGKSETADTPESLAAWAQDKHSGLLGSAGLDADPRQANKVIAAKFPKGPGLSTAQYRLVDKFSNLRSIKGANWLSHAGMFTVPRAEEYLEDHKFQTWLRLDAANRVLLAYIAWRRRGDLGEDVVAGTPPYNLGRSMDAKDKKVKRRDQKDIKEAIDEDIRGQWLKTLANPSDGDKYRARQGIRAGGALDHKQSAMDEADVMQTHASAQVVLERVLLMLHAGLQVYNDKEGEHQDYKGSVVRALSHGGRVTVRVPQIVKKKDANRLMEWLGVTSKSGKLKKGNGFFKRAFGTHHQAIGKNEKGVDGKRVAGTGKFREQGGKGAAIDSKVGSTQLFGLNLAAGGLGKRDFNGDVILPDGAHGHLLLVWRPPTTDRDGALQIGIETTGPHAPSTVGYTHNAQSSEATANPESSFGGLKADKVGDGSPDVLGLRLKAKSEQRHRDDAKTNARLVDLTKMGDKWLDDLKELESQFQDLKKSVSNANEYLVGTREDLKDALDA